MAKEKSFVCCPGCKKSVEAKYYAVHPLGSVMPTIQCHCGYKGLPVKMSMKEYEKLIQDIDCEV